MPPRFYPILDTGLLGAATISAEAAAAAILDAGARILQFRHKGHFSRSVFEEARRVRDLCLQADAQFVINDRADMALLLAADLHIGQDDLPASEARKLLGSRARLGLSTHNERQLLDAAAEPVDYLALGPVFATKSKTNPDPVLGTAEFRRLRSLTRLPLVAIGGITRETARPVLNAGADSIAVIGDLFAPPCDAGSLRERVRDWIDLVA